jgi:hypothetical protein
MNTLNVAHLAVVSREGAHLVGYLSWRDLLRVRNRLQQEERDRTTFYRWLLRLRLPASRQAEQS